MPLKIYSDDQPRIVDSLEELHGKYITIRAAGGLVVDDDGQLLMIFRRGKWDLPKGKFEDGESLEDCAHREVMEETGLEFLHLDRPLIATYHTYTERDKQYLKETHWYLFHASGDQPVYPQTEEDITAVEWVFPKDLPNYTNNTYGLIKDVLTMAGFGDFL